MKILVTGSNGFVGKAFCEYAKSEGDEVIGYDLPNNILDENRLEKAIEKVDLVVHMAAIADLYETAKDLDMNFNVNVRGTWNVAKYCNNHNVKLCFISTCCVYGNTDDEIETEDKTIPKTTEPYACSKMAGEYLLRGFHDLKYNILRIGTVYGEGMRESLFNFIAFEKIIKGETVSVFGDGLQTRNYVYIDDLVRHIYTSLYESIDCEIYNICSSEQIMVLETIRIVQRIVGKEARVEFYEGRDSEILEENILNEKISKIIPGRHKRFIPYLVGMAQTFLNDERLQEWHKIYSK